MNKAPFAPRLAGLLTLVATPASFLLLTSCDVKQTQEAKAPTVAVSPGQMPKYDVDTAKVSVDSKKTEVTVPKVTTEQKTVTVPDVKITMPGESPAAAATLRRQRRLLLRRRLNQARQVS